MSNDIHLTQCGQPRAYADSIYAGTVKAASEQEARDKLAKMRHTPTIFDKQDREKWSFPYFTEFREIESGTWKFRIVEEFTD